MDGLHLTSAPLVPEVRLFLAEDPIILWARMEAHAGRKLEAPFWASAWSGGQAVARYVLDNPDLVAGRRVLDLASGSGIVAIAAALSGASSVAANDIDPCALAAIEMNAAANSVHLDLILADTLDSAEPDPADVVLAGDVLYSDSMAARFLSFLEHAAQSGARVFLGDPGRGWLPGDSWLTLATYPVSVEDAERDAQLTSTSVLTPNRVVSARG